MQIHHRIQMCRGSYHRPPVHPVHKRILTVSLHGKLNAASAITQRHATSHTLY